jgi:hypothetical protein
VPGGEGLDDLVEGGLNAFAVERVRHCDATSRWRAGR